MRNLDICTSFGRPRDLDAGLRRDLERNGTALDQLAADPDLVRRFQTAIAAANANTTLQPGFTTRVTPPPSGQVVLLLPLLNDSQENVEADLIITGRSSATYLVLAPRRSTVNGQASLTLTAAPYWYRFKWHGGNWYHG